MSQVLRHIPPVPPNFERRFIDGGWREVEQHYGARTNLLMKWIEMSGGEELLQRRRQHMRQNGVGRHACPGGNRVAVKGVDTKGWLG